MVKVEDQNGKGTLMVKQRAKTIGIVGAAFVLACLCALALYTVRASALPFAHSEEEADAGSGLVHIAVTLDCSAVGGSTTFAWLPVKADDASVTAVMNEFLKASENKVDRFAHEDYNLQSMTDFLAGKNYTVAVYEAGSQEPGDEVEYTSSSVGDESYTGLKTGDAVYVTVVE